MGQVPEGGVPAPAPELPERRGPDRLEHQRGRGDSGALPEPGEKLEGSEVEQEHEPQHGHPSRKERGGVRQQGRHSEEEGGSSQNPDRSPPGSGRGHVGTPAVGLRCEEAPGVHPGRGEEVCQVTLPPGSFGEGAQGPAPGQPLAAGKDCDRQEPHEGPARPFRRDEHGDGGWKEEQGEPRPRSVTPPAVWSFRHLVFPVKDSGCGRHHAGAARQPKGAAGRSPAQGLMRRPSPSGRPVGLTHGVPGSGHGGASCRFR